MNPPRSLTIAVPLTLAALSAAHAAPATPEIQTVYRLANSARDTLRCAPVALGETPPPENLVAAREYADIAGMYAFAARNYPDVKGAERAHQVNSILIEAARAYRSAYACAPDELGATYLFAGIELLGERVRHLVQVDKHAPDAEIVTPLSKQIEELREALPPAHQCPVCKKCPPCQQTTPEPPRGYRGLHAGRLHLSLGFGLGRARLDGDDLGKLTVFTFRGSLGPRFVLGKRRRHALTTGLDYALHRPFSYTGESADDVAAPSAWHQAGPFLDWGFAPHRHFALHLRAAVHVTAGVITFAGDRPPNAFHAIALGGGGGVCTLGSALCLRVHAYRSPVVGRAPDRPNLFSGYDVTLNLDLFRVADNVLARRARRSPGAAP